MKYEIPEKIRNLVPYEPINGEYKIRLDANEAYSNPTETLLKAFENSIKSTKLNRYPDPNATELCKAFGEFYSVSCELVTAFDGSDEVLALICATFFSAGQKLAVFSDDFSMYKQYANTYATECVVIPKEKNLMIDVDKTIAFLIENNISALLFSNPCNPTSLGLKRSEVIKIITNTQALVIVDEAYMDFWNESVLNRVESFDNLIVLKTCSKAIGLAGIRLGFAVASKGLTRVFKAVKSPYNVNSISQEIGRIALNEHEYLTNLVSKICKNRIWLQEKFEMLDNKFPTKIKTYKSCTNFIFIEVLETGGSDKIWKELILSSIAVRKMGNYLRITAGSEEENKILCDEFERILINQ